MRKRHEIAKAQICAAMIAGACFALASPPVMAADLEPAAEHAFSNDAGAGSGSFMSAYGFAEHDAFAAKPPTVEIDLDQQKAVEHIKEMRGMQMLNESVNEATANAKPTIFALGLLIQYSVLSVKSTFENNPNLDRVHFIAQSILADDFGNDQKHELFSFDFTRENEKKINWDKFQNASLVKVSQNFHFGSWAREHLPAEKDAE